MDAFLNFLMSRFHRPSKKPLNFREAIRLAFPDDYTIPTALLKGINVSLVSFPVLSQFGPPVFRVRFWLVTFAAGVAVPKTAMHENSSLPSRKDDVRLSWQIFAV